VQEPQLAGRVEPGGFSELLQAERQTSRALHARIAELERDREQLQKYAVDLQRTHAELRHWNAGLNVLQEAGTSIAAALDEELVLQRVLAALPRLAAHDCAQVYLTDESGSLQCRSNTGNCPVLDLKERHAWQPGQLGYHVYQSIESQSTAVLVDEHASLIVPLQARGRVTGVLLLLRDAEHPFTEDDQRLVSLLASLSAVAVDNAHLYQKTERMATTDALTDLFNYRYFHQALAQECARAKRQGFPVGVLMADLDHFKLVNDRYGHPKGDEVLREVARVAQLELRRTDVLARLGGEEFAALLPGANVAAVSHVGEKLRAAVARIELPSGNSLGPIHATISVGGVTLPPERAEPRVLLDLADQALFRAKQSGRNRVEIDRAEEA
jgi:diguanylate cyclase (GGDEF)-like protein